MKTRISFDLDTTQLDGYTDQHLAALWHISQANPAPFGDRVACQVPEYISREIVRRFLQRTPPELWTHQVGHVAIALKLSATSHEGGTASACSHLWEAHPIDGSGRASVQSIAVCKLCGEKGGME